MKFGHCLLLVVAVLFHISLLVSWRTGLWNRFTFDSTATRGQKGWDFYALYQAGHNALHGLSLYETSSDKLDLVVPVRTPYRYLPMPGLTIGILLNLAPPIAAFWVWAVILELVLLYCCWRSWRLASTAREGLFLVLFWLLFTPYYLEIYLGQFTLIQAGLIFMLLTWPQNKLKELGFDLVWLASILWKQFTAIFLPVWVILRRWRGILVTGAGLVVLTLPYFLVYPGSWSTFLKNTRIVPGTQMGNLGALQLVYAVIL
ncbi:MAG: glycosyltransferase family 87 protein, partial [Anaerolineae bacterium]